MVKGPAVSQVLVNSRVAMKCILLLVAATLYQCVMVHTHGLFRDALPLLLCIPVILVLIVSILFPFQSPRLSSNRIAIFLGLVTILVQGAAQIRYRDQIYYSPLTDLETTSMLVCSIVMTTACFLSVFVEAFQKRILIILATSVLIYICFSRVMLTKPGIDVWLFHQDSAAALLKGINPYSITFYNMYGFGTPYYSEQVQQGDRVLFGFPYPPMSLLMYLPSYIMTGESRYAHALAFALAGAIVTSISRGKVGMLAGLLLLMAPASTAVIESSWTEPFLIFWLAIVAWTAVRKPSITPYMLGLFFSMKQYTIIFIPLVFLILPRPFSFRTSSIYLLKIVVTGAIVSLPLAMWDWHAFWNSNVTIQVKQPFRYDSFSFLAMYANAKATELAQIGQEFQPPEWWSMIAFTLMLPVYLLVFWKAPRNIAGFMLSLTLTLVIFLFFNRQAFLNYHTLGAAAMLISVATLEAVYIEKAGKAVISQAADV